MRRCEKGEIASKRRSDISKQAQPFVNPNKQTTCKQAKRIPEQDEFKTQPRFRKQTQNQAEQPKNIASNAHKNATSPQIKSQLKSPPTASEAAEKKASAANEGEKKEYSFDKKKNGINKADYIVKDVEKQCIERPCIRDDGSASQIRIGGTHISSTTTVAIAMLVNQGEDRPHPKSFPQESNPPRSNPRYNLCTPPRRAILRHGRDRLRVFPARPLRDANSGLREKV